MKKALSIGLLALLALQPSGASTEAPLDEGSFSHPMHTENAGLECGDCHSVQGGGLPYLALMPGASACLDCHDEEVLSALPERPSSHAGDYRYLHQFDARSQGTGCALCHLESEGCSICHHGENVDVLAHDRNWLYSHAVTARKGTEDCAGCHDATTYCNGCHADFGVQPSDHFSADWQSGDGGRHAVEGRIGLGRCVLCHGGDSPSCTICHN